MSTTEFQLTEDKYLFTFQDESQLWISKEFIEKYQQFPFHNIIEHSEKYDDSSYYVDMLPFHIEQVISFLMDDNVDVFSLNLKESYDIYKTLVEYSVTIDNEIQSDLLLHIKDLFYNYLKDNNYDIDGCYCKGINSCVPIKLFGSNSISIVIKGLFTPQKKDDLLYYSLLIKMMNVTQVRIMYDYASNIPIEYICPSCIQDIFPSLKELWIIVNINYNKTDILLNPNGDDYKIQNSAEYDYYTKLKKNKNKQISSLNFNRMCFSNEMIDHITGKRRINELSKQYKYVVNEAIYTNNYSHVELNETKDGYTLKDMVSIKYDNKTNNKTLTIHEVSTEHGISQLFLLPSHLLISNIILLKYWVGQYNSVVFMKLFEEGFFDSSTVLNIGEFKKFTEKIDDDLISKIMTTHVFPNVTELIYNDTTDNYESLFHVNLLSMIDTIHIHKVNPFCETKIISYLDNIAYTHSIHIDGIVYSSRSGNIKVVDSIRNYKLNIDSLLIVFNNDYPEEVDEKNKLERFLNCNIFEHLNTLDVSFREDITIEYLTWISTLFNDNKFNTIQKLNINSYFISKLSSEYLTAFENIMIELIPKASIVKIDGCTMNFFNRLISKGCFHNTIQLILESKDIPDDNFFKLYTADNFPKLEYFKFYINEKEWWIDFLKIFCKYINNNNFPSSSVIQLSDGNSYYNYIYDPNTSILRCKYDGNSLMNTIIVYQYKEINKSEIEMLFDCINENKTQNINSLGLYIHDEEQVSKFISFITSGKIPKLKEVIVNIDRSFYENIDIYEQQLNDSLFIKEKHVYYKINKI
ncbi:hypothetical protein WA158_007060 [Blastocystis sp. Blastoise]